MLVLNFCSVFVTFAILACVSAQVTISLNGQWIVSNENKGTFHLLFKCTLSSAENICKQFGPRSGPTECRSRSGSKLVDTMRVFLEEYFEKVNFEKSQQTTTKA